MEEIWKQVVDYEDLYEVSNLGRVRSLDRVGTDGRKLKGVLLSPRTNNRDKEKGYLSVSLYKNNIKRGNYIHRLVASAFILNDDESKNIVNHIDGDKLNNCADNLEWTDSFGNMRHASKNGLLDNLKEKISARCSKPCSLIRLQDNKIIEFKNQEELSIFIGFNSAWFSKALKNNKNINKTLETKGYNLYKYIE